MLTASLLFGEKSPAPDAFINCWGTGVQRAIVSKCAATAAGVRALGLTLPAGLAANPVLQVLVVDRDQRPHCPTGCCAWDVEIDGIQPFLHQLLAGGKQGPLGGGLLPATKHWDRSRIGLGLGQGSGLGSGSGLVRVGAGSWVACPSAPPHHPFAIIVPGFCEQATDIQGSTRRRNAFFLMSQLKHCAVCFKQTDITQTTK